jgi:TRAP-type transport system periplasmic protein
MSMNKRSFGAILVVGLFVSVFLGVAVTAGPVYAQGAPKTIELKWSTQWAPNSAEAEDTKKFGDLITKRTDGKVKISYFHAETLGKSRDFLEMLDKGVADIITIIPSMYQGQFDMMGVFDVPMLGVVYRPVATEIAWELFYNGNLKEFDKYKVLAFDPSDAFTTLLRKKKITRLDDFKGLKIRTPSAMLGGLMTAFGATPISMPASEVYMAMDRGVIDGYVSSFTSMISRKMYEVGSYVIGSPRLCSGVIPILMSRKVWNSLPRDAQEGIEDAITEYKYVSLRNYQDRDKAVYDVMKRNKVTVIDLSPAETARVQKAADAIIDKWAAERDAKGQPGKTSIELVRKIIGRYSF